MLILGYRFWIVLRIVWNLSQWYLTRPRYPRMYPLSVRFLYETACSIDFFSDYPGIFDKRIEKKNRVFRIEYFPFSFIVVLYVKQQLVALFCFWHFKLDCCNLINCSKNKAYTRLKNDQESYEEVSQLLIHCNQTLIVQFENMIWHSLIFQYCFHLSRKWTVFLYKWKIH